MKQYISPYGVWILTHTAFVSMLIMLMINPSYWKLLTPYSGYTSVGFLVLVLSLNPLKAIFPSSLLLKRLNNYRQEFGVACFSYAFVHFLCFIIKRGSLGAVLSFMLHPALIPVFFIGFPILLLLAATSSKIALKKMGFLRWKRLHTKVYLAEASIIVHMFLVGEKLWAWVLFSPLVVLQFLRIMRRKKI